MRPKWFWTNHRRKEANDKWFPTKSHLHFTAFSHANFWGDGFERERTGRSRPCSNYERERPAGNGYWNALRLELWQTGCLLGIVAILIPASLLRLSQHRGFTRDPWFSTVLVSKFRCLHFILCCHRWVDKLAVYLKFVLTGTLDLWLMCLSDF